MNSCHAQDIRHLCDSVEEVGAKIESSKKSRVKKQMVLNKLRSKNSASLNEKEEKQLGQLRGELKKNLGNLIRTVGSVEKAIRALDKKANGKSVADLTAELDTAKKKESSSKNTLKNKQAALKALKSDLAAFNKRSKEFSTIRKESEKRLKSANQRENKKSELMMWQAEVAEADNYINKM